MRQLFQTELSQSMNRIETSVNLQERRLQLIVEFETAVHDISRCIMSKIFSLSNAGKSGSDSAPLKILETAFCNLNLRNENSKRLLEYLLFDERFIPIAKARGVIAAGSAILIHAAIFHEFIPSELYTLLEFFHLRNEQFILSAASLAPSASANQVQLTLVSRASEGAKCSDLKVRGLSATIESLESEILSMADKEKAHEVAFLSQLQQKNSRG